MLTTTQDALASATIIDNALRFPVEIERKIYTKVKIMLEAIRGDYKSNGGDSRFEFSFDPTNIIERFLSGDAWPKKNPYALFPTPASILSYATKYTRAGASQWAGYERVRILEPLAGRGDFIDAIAQDFAKQGIHADITCVEIDPVNIEILTSKGYQVIAGDFMGLTAEQLGEFDLIVMNPPFQGTTYIKHVNHAQTFLKRYGSLIAVLPTSLFTSNTSCQEPIALTCISGLKTMGRACPTAR